MFYSKKIKFNYRELQKYMIINAYIQIPEISYLIIFDSICATFSLDKKIKLEKLLCYLARGNKFARSCKELKKLSKKQLKQICKNGYIKSYSKLNKNDLIEDIRKHEFNCIRCEYIFHFFKNQQKTYTKEIHTKLYEVLAIKDYERKRKQALVFFHFLTQEKYYIYYIMNVQFYKVCWNKINEMREVYIDTDYEEFTQIYNKLLFENILNSISSKN